MKIGRDIVWRRFDCGRMANPNPTWCSSASFVAFLPASVCPFVSGCWPVQFGRRCSRTKISESVKCTWARTVNHLNQCSRRKTNKRTNIIVKKSIQSKSSRIVWWQAVNLLYIDNVRKERERERSLCPYKEMEKQKPNPNMRLTSGLGVLLFNLHRIIVFFLGRFLRLIN